MKKVWLTLLALMLTAAMTFGLTACIDTPDEPGPGGESEVAEIVGDYSIDLSALGMPLTVYLRIEDSGAFQFSGKTDFSQDKNSGTVKKSSTGYMMVYSIINNEAATGKTTNLTKEADGSLKFDGTVYYGSTKPTSPMTNEDTGETAYLYAVPLTGEDPSGDEVTLEKGLYFGTYESAGMGSTVEYQYYLNLREDGKFTAFVSFDMMGGTNYVYDYGTYTMMGAICRMTSEVYQDTEDETKPLTESVMAESATEVTAEVKMSPMAKDTVEVTLAPVEEADLIATFTSSKSMPAMMGGGSYSMTLEVYADGSYAYTCKDDASGAVTVEESGFLGLSMMGTAYLLPDEATEGLEGVYDSETNQITGLKFQMDKSAPRGELTFTLAAE